LDPNTSVEYEHAVPQHLSRRNLESWHQAIDWSFWGIGNFCEAVKIARKLGSRYLWIDALCIVQDDLDEWRRESATMGEIFANAFCNISATVSTAADDQIWHASGERNLLLAQPCRAVLAYPSANNVGGSNGADGAEKGSIYHIAPYNLRGDVVEKSMLHGRAWAFTERILAHRTIHFSKNQLFWECRELVRNTFSLQNSLNFSFYYSISHVKADVFIYK
jgi:hypothetical protein